MQDDQAFSETDAFFAWTFEKRHPLWQTLLSFFWPVLTLAICLFPVYPHRCKLIVLYSCAGILLMILSLLFGKLCICNMFSVLYFSSVLFHSDDTLFLALNLGDDLLAIYA